MKDKKVILVDDSIVRGTTIKMLIDHVRKVGKAKEVHIRVACPPIIAPCFYGIDMSTISELLVPKYHKGEIDNLMPDDAIERMRKDIGADSLYYQSHESLVKAIGLPKKDICMACLDCKYPTECGKKLYCDSVENHKNGVCKRTYE